MIVTLTDPVDTALLRYDALTAGASYDAKIEMLPTCTPAVTLILVLPNAPAAVKQLTVVEDTHTLLWHEDPPSLDIDEYVA